MLNFNFSLLFFFLLCEMFMMSKNTKCEIHNVPYVLPSFFFLSHNGCHGKVWRLKKIPPFESCLLEKNWLLWKILKKRRVKCIYPPPGEKTATSFKLYFFFVKKLFDFIILIFSVGSLGKKLPEIGTYNPPPPLTPLFRKLLGG